MKEQYILPLNNKWLPSTWYLVEVSFSKNNPIHRALFFSGFLNEGKPSGYNNIIISGDAEEINNMGIDSVLYMEAIKVIIYENELEYTGGLPDIKIFRVLVDKIKNKTKRILCH